MTKSLKELLDEYRKRLEQLEPHHQQYKERASGFLDMSDEVDKIWEREYIQVKEFVEKLEQILAFENKQDEKTQKALEFWNMLDASAVSMCGKSVAEIHYNKLTSLIDENNELKAKLNSQDTNAKIVQRLQKRKEELEDLLSKVDLKNRWAYELAIKLDLTKSILESKE